MTISHELKTYTPRTAARTAAFRESVIREMTRLGDEAGAVNLSQGLPDFTPPEEVLAAAAEAIRSGDNQYTFPFPFGAPAFRAAIAEYMTREVGVAVIPGSSFYMDETQGAKRVRFNFAKDTGTLGEAARRLQQLRRALA